MGNDWKISQAIQGRSQWWSQGYFIVMLIKPWDLRISCHFSLYKNTYDSHHSMGNFISYANHIPWSLLFFVHIYFSHVPNISHKMWSSPQKSHLLRGNPQFLMELCCLQDQGYMVCQTWILGWAFGTRVQAFPFTSEKRDPWLLVTFLRSQQGSLRQAFA